MVGAASLDQRVAGVEHQIDDDLLQPAGLAEVTSDAGQTASRRLRSTRATLQLLVQQVAADTGGVGEVERVALVGRLARHGAQIVDDVGGALGLGRDALELLFKKSISAAGSCRRLERPSSSMQASAARRMTAKRLVDLVRHARGHLAEIGEARGVEQADLGQAALGVVDADQHDVAQLPYRPAPEWR